jgi:multidrug efflux system membrane fusion protein
MKVQAFIPGSDGGSAEGTLTFVDNAIDMATGTIRLRGEFSNEDGRLWPGQYVNVVLTLGRQSNARVIPTVAVQTGQQGRYVFVVKSDHTVEAKPVTLGSALGDETVIETGLEVGETVVTDGQFRLVPGSRVEVRSAPAAAEKSGG